MEIKRTTEIFVETNRRFVIRQSESGEQIICPNCCEPMLAAEAIAAVFGISRRAVYRLIETETAHFAETETGAVMICPSSLAAFFGNDAKQLPGANGE
ncbi:MAG: hypothetical protein MSG64_06145 [Pyrinomonadaceae bacterium MAG19_C2-C3]|nr:hypothetical protein [Pyrinomonadaceae bacterium MAG19_C2-C3]